MKVYSITVNLPSPEGELKLRPKGGEWSLQDVPQIVEAIKEKYPTWTSFVVILVKPDYERIDG
jgi:hypothetical protein